jgi:hypothetical protein
MVEINPYQVLVDVVVWGIVGAYVINLCNRIDIVTRRLYFLHCRLDKQHKKLIEMRHEWYEVMMDVEGLKKSIKGDNK